MAYQVINRASKPMAFLPVILTLVLISSPASAQDCAPRSSLPLSVLSTHNDPANVSARDAVARYRARDQVIIAYVKGVADGYTWAGAAERPRGAGGRLFCEPQVDFNADFAIMVLENFLRRSPRGSLEVCGSLPAVFLRAFQAAFPCP